MVAKTSSGLDEECYRFAGKLAALTRVSQRAVEKVGGKGSCRAMFSLVDAVVAMAKSQDREGPYSLVPVQADVAVRTALVSDSLQQHRADCLTLGYPVHNASKAAALAGSSGQLKHQKSNVAKHNWHDLFVANTVAVPPAQQLDDLQAELDRFLAKCKSQARPMRSIAPVFEPVENFEIDMVGRLEAALVDNSEGQYSTSIEQEMYVAQQRARRRAQIEATYVNPCLTLQTCILGGTDLVASVAGSQSHECEISPADSSMAGLCGNIGDGGSDRLAQCVGADVGSDDTAVVSDGPVTMAPERPLTWSTCSKGHELQRFQAAQDDLYQCDECKAGEAWQEQLLAVQQLVAG